MLRSFSRLAILFFFPLVGLINQLAGAQSTPAPARTSLAKTPKSTPFRIVAYLPDYRLQTLVPAQLDHVTDLIFFSIAPTAEGDLDLQRCTPEALTKLHTLTRGRALRLTIAVGGWARGDGFAPMIANPKAREHFIQTLTQFCHTNKFAGADFDWEGPQNAVQQAGYGTLMQEVKRRFVAEGLHLSIAQASWEKLPQVGLEAVDEIHIMAYDHDGQHATPAQAQEDIAAFIKKGVPKKKLFLGLPFYGRDIHDRNKEMTYADIVQRFHPAAETDMAGDFYFNNVRTIVLKTKAAQQDGLGGVMIWELGQDTTNETSLLQAIAHASGKTAK